MISKAFHASRRKLLMDLMVEGSMAFLFSGYEKQDRGDQTFPFTPESNFYYMTGFSEPKAILMMAKVRGRTEETLFIDHPDQESIRWLGVFYTKESVQEDTGIKSVEYLESFEDSLPMFWRPGIISHLYIDIANYEGRFGNLNPAQRFANKVREYDQTIVMHNVCNDIGQMRHIKEPEEICLHRKAAEITAAGVDSILKHLHPEMRECESEAYFDFVLKTNNTIAAYPTIAASGINACSMHYTKNDRLMHDGDMILYDLGAQWNYYAADVSRTFPVNGKFTDHQAQIYEIVLDALKTMISQTRPGLTMQEVQKFGMDAAAEELEKAGIISSPSEVGSCYFNGCHYVGLNVHDVGDYFTKMKPGMVITLEPMIYFDDQELGIRIEDTILITDDGCEVLTGMIPKEIQEIEKAMKH